MAAITSVICWRDAQRIHSELSGSCMEGNYSILEHAQAWHCIFWAAIFDCYRIEAGACYGMGF